MAASWLHPPVEQKVRPQPRPLPQHARACVCDMRTAAAHVCVQLPWPHSHPFPRRCSLSLKVLKIIESKSKNPKELSFNDEMLTNESSSSIDELAGEAGRRGRGEQRRFAGAGRKAREGAAAEGMEEKRGCGSEEAVVRGPGRAAGGANPPHGDVAGVACATTVTWHHGAALGL